MNDCLTAKVEWVVSRDGESYLMFAGGLPEDVTGAQPSITVMQVRSPEPNQPSITVMKVRSPESSYYNRRAGKVTGAEPFIPVMQVRSPESSHS